MDIKKKFKTLDCQLSDPYDPTKKIVVESRNEKDEYLLPKICKQIEFYLGDANLANDRYFTKLLQENQNYVPLESFLRCNKIKTLLLNYPKHHQQQIAILALSLKRSQILKLDKQELSVRRFEKFEDDKQYMEDRTIYVENLPTLITNEILYEIFGNIDQHILKVQIYKKYGFVTFLNPESVQKAIQHYHNYVPKEFIQKQIKIRGALRVLSKSEWLQYKQQYKEIKLLLKNKQISTEIVEKQQIKLVNVLQQDLKVEELRIAIIHAIDTRSIMHVNINKEMFYCLIECSNKQAVQTLKNNLYRIQNYDQRFRNSYFI